jgi:polygalacturonase
LLRARAPRRAAILLSAVRLFSSARPRADGDETKGSADEPSASTMIKRPILVGLGLALLAAQARAQDSRTIAEPVIPPLCATLDAHLSAVRQGPFVTLAPADEVRLDTARIQQAMDRCGAGKAVALRVAGSADAFVSGPLELRSGVTLVVDKGATLLTSINSSLFENAPGSCGIVNDLPGPGCKPFLSVKNVAGAGVMGEGVIDGRGGVPLLGKTMAAWDIAQASNPGGKRLSRLIVADHANDFTLYGITLRNAPNFNVSYNAGDGFTVWGVKIDTPRRDTKAVRPSSRNTDGIDPGNGSRNITITQSFIRVGDDNIAIKGGPGGATNITISHNHFYWGHGMSIGSQTLGGVSKVHVVDLTLDGTDSGLRIKSAGDRGGVVSDIVYQDVCIRGSERPIDIDAAYDANNAIEGASRPVYRDIVLRDVQIFGGGDLVLNGYDRDHRAEVLLDGVYLDDPARTQNPYVLKSEHADVTVGQGGANFPLTRAIASAPAMAPAQRRSHACAGRFVAFPDKS